ncbi:MAG: DNA translocase FtsK 4TM domain-containing protein [Roseinatronobacter sp.]|nr:DNA translocase FtsK 4TM domain-containing protein [Roseinatronobacter sp.]
MASYNTRSRDPLLDSNLQALLQKRGRELLGLVLIGVAGLVAVMLGTYAPNDPSWMSSSNVPIENALGLVGATISSPLMIIIGKASFGLVVFFFGWGLRLVTSRGHEQALARGIFLPIALALSAIWCATLVPSAGWDMLYGMGGIFGDTVLGAIVSALPMAPAAGVTLMGVVMLAVMLAGWAYVMGVSGYELRLFLRFVLTGFVLAYSGLVAALRGGAAQGLRGATLAGGAMARKVEDSLAARAQARSHTPAQPEGAPWSGREYPGQDVMSDAAMQPAAQGARRSPPVIRPSGYAPAPAMAAAPEDDLFEALPHGTDAPARWEQSAPQDAPAGGLLGRLKALSARPMGEEPPLRGELVEPQLSASALQAQPGGEARIKTRIADAIRHHKGAKPVLKFDRTRHAMPEPPLRAPAPVAAPVPGPVLGPQSMPAASLQASVDATLAPVPMPDWMLAAQPVAQQAALPQAPQPVAMPAPQMAAPLVAEPLFQPDAPRGPHVLTRRVVNTAPRRPQPSRQAQAEAAPGFSFEPNAPVFELPPLGLLENPGEVQRFTLSDEALEENARMLENVLDDYGVRGEIVSVRPGPVVTQYELEPAPGLKASRVIGLADDIARSMSALSARVSTVPGRSIIGIELPNAHREKVVLREILAARDFGDANMRLPLALGKAIDGEPIVANLAKMPHLLIAGTTGSGKSVAINTMILSLLYRLGPDECRMIMIDPKMLELSVYDGIPHLLSPVVTDPKKAVVALKWVVGEMEERYRKMSKMGVRNIEGYNGRVREALAKGEMFKRTIQTGFDDESGDPIFESEEFAPEVLPFIVVIVDEMADLMMVAGKEIEACIQRLAQMARASGIHLIMATQRPSVDVITGTIKANFPTRISFQVTSKIDSRTILGEQGAEQLLGMGDMLYMAGGGRINRIHGPFVSDEEVEEVVNHLKSFGPPDYKSGVVDGPENDREADIDAVLGLGGNTTGEDALYDQAVQVVIQDRKCSTSYIQRKLGIGYNKAARLVEQMEDEGLVTPANHVGKREILVPEQG